MSINRLPRYRRVEDYPRPFIGRPKARILAALARYHYLSARQLTRLLVSPTSLTYVQDHLKQLFRARYVNRVYLPTNAPHGSPQAIYCLDRQGMAFLKSEGQAPEGRFRPSEEAHREWLFLRHTLAANELLILVECLAREDIRFHLAALRSERELKSDPVVVPLRRGRATVIPDGWVELHYYQEAAASRQFIAFELDRGTVQRKAFQRKIEALLAFANGPYQAEYGAQGLEPVMNYQRRDQQRGEAGEWRKR